MRYSVLIVEDNHALAHLYKTVIEEAGCSALTAGSGSEALSLLASIEPPALILLDFSMPEMSGEAFLRLLRLNHSDIFKTVPVVGLTGLKPDAPSLKGFRSLVSECVEKPDDIDTLLRIVNKFTRCHEES